jgi:hypothetical protein
VNVPGGRGLGGYLRAAVLLSAFVCTGCVFEIIDPAPPVDVQLISHHGRYVTAASEEGQSEIRQETEPSSCSVFTEHHLANGRIALETCRGHYITAPMTGLTLSEYRVSQQPRLTKCGRFEVHEQGDGRIALKACSGAFVTAGDGNWPSGMAWALAAQAENISLWERFEVRTPDK